MPINGPQARYQRALQQEHFTPDAAQQNAVAALQSLYEELILRYQRLKRRRGLALLNERRRQQLPATGLYLWGGVGRGKTWLMDIFFEALPFRRKMRVHFHRFMQRVHHELTRLQGHKDPLTLVAEILHREAVVICFDEFFVTDITDAMILGGLFERLFERGVTLVATSNIEPDRLYENGLQRQRFLPAIALVKAHCRVLNVDAGIDYRLRVLTQAALFYTPLGAESHAQVSARFHDLTAGQTCHPEPIQVNHRAVTVINRTEDVLWLRYDELCQKPRSAHDFIELAREYHSVIIEDVPTMGAHNDDAARRFINLIDEFYDRGVKVILSAEAPILGLYTGGRLNFEFERTQSRLQEMQSTDYLEREHKPD